MATVIPDYDEEFGHETRNYLTREMKQSELPINYGFGRKEIKIPLSNRSLDSVSIQKWLPYCLAIHSENLLDILHQEEVYKGKSNIFNKVRPLTEDKKNTIVNENHIKYMIDWKTSQMAGTSINYASIDDDDSQNMDKIKVLNKYSVSQIKGKKDYELYKASYKHGNAFRMVKPKPTEKIRNILKESPYELINLDNMTTFVVYSSNYTHEKLFGVIITTLDSPNPNTIKYEILVYTDKEIFRFNCNSLKPVWEELDYLGSTRHFLNYCPIVEYVSNDSRMGIVDIVETIIDAVNSISSDAVDNVNDFVNSILAIYNMELDDNSRANIERNKAILLKTVDPTRPADAKYLENELNQTDVMTKYEALVKTAYNICGVPLQSTQSTSGGDTGEARSLGGGWESSNIIALGDEQLLKGSEIECLEIILAICELTNGCPIKDIYVSDIDVNYNRTNRYNILSKTQALQNLDAIGMPEEDALNMVGVTNNPHELGVKWHNHKMLLKKEQVIEEEKKVPEIEEKGTNNEDNEEIEE